MSGRDGAPVGVVGTLRLVLRGVAMVAVTAAGWVYVLIGMLVLAPFGRWRLWRDHSIHVWCHAMLAIAGVRVTPTGPVPRGGCLIVANHLSYLDVLVLGAQRPVCFVAKAEVARWPGIGLVCRSIGIVFVPRENKRALPEVARRLARELERGSAVVMFPEGTTTAGDRVLPFRASLLAPVAAARLPVAYAALGYETPAGHPPARDAVCWWGDMDFAPHFLGLLRLPSVRARVAFGDEAIVEEDRKALAQRLERGVVALFEPSSPPVEAGAGAADDPVTPRPASGAAEAGR